MIAFFLILAFAFAEETATETSSSVSETVVPPETPDTTPETPGQTQSSAQPSDTTPAADEAYKNKKYVMVDTKDLDAVMDVTLLNVCYKYDEEKNIYRKIVGHNKDYYRKENYANDKCEGEPTETIVEPLCEEESGYKYCEKYVDELPEHFAYTQYHNDANCEKGEAEIEIYLDVCIAIDMDYDGTPDLYGKNLIKDNTIASQYYSDKDCSKTYTPPGSDTDNNEGDTTEREPPQCDKCNNIGDKDDPYYLYLGCHPYGSGSAMTTILMIVAVLFFIF